MSKIKFKHKTTQTSTGFLFWQASLLWQRQIAKALAALHLTHAQFVLLASTAWLTNIGNEPISQALLAAHAKTDIMMTSKVVRTLIEKKLMQRIDHPTDTRAYALHLTKAGETLTQQALDAVEKVDASFFEEVANPAAFRKELADLINRHTKE